MKPSKRRHSGKKLNKYAYDLRDTTHSFNRHAEQKFVDAEQERDNVKILAVHDVMRWEQRHDKTKRDVEERFAILEHTSIVARRQFDLGCGWERSPNGQVAIRIQCCQNRGRASRGSMDQGE